LQNVREKCTTERCEPVTRMFLQQHDISHTCSAEGKASSETKPPAD
jgi:hypothetical protein